MVFSSLEFIIGFMPLFFLIYYLIPDKWEHSVNARNLLLFIGSLIMISLGIIGYYIARIYDEVKGRPRYIIEEYRG